MHPRLRPLFVPLALLTLSLSTSGCVLQSLLGMSTVYSISEEVSMTIAAIEAHATVAICADLRETFPTTPVTCSYFVDGMEITSTTQLISEFGLSGVIVDPVIVQLPASISSITGTYDDGGGAKPLDIQSGLTSIPVEPGVALTAEPGKQLVIVDLPASLTLPVGDPSAGLPLGFTFNFSSSGPPGTQTAPLKVKALFAAKLAVQGVNYYVPLLPCTTDLSTLPEITLPDGAGFQNVAAAVATALTGRACNGQVYNFGPSGPGGTEDCGNCIDDDADGLVDFEDSACCGGAAPGTLEVQRARLAPGQGGTRLLLKARAGGIDLGTPPAAHDVVLQLRSPGAGDPFCATFPADHLRRRRNGLDLKDPKGTLAGAGGVQRARLRVKKDGSTSIDARGRGAKLATPPAGPLQVTWAVSDPAVTTGASVCRSTAVTLSEGRKGSRRFP